ncbi:MAG: hypothetical protein U0325_24335 [Polyangiales bacterium]
MRRGRHLALALLALVGCGTERPDSAPRIDAGDPFSARLDAPNGGSASRPPSGYPAYDLTLTLPFRGEARSFEVTVEPRATRLDVHFNVDTTGSFSGEIANLKSSLGNFVIPRLRERAADLALGVSRFADFPLSPFGFQTDRPYDLLSPVTTDFGRVFGAVNGLDQPLQNGGDIPESWLESLYQIATGAGLRSGAFTIPTVQQPAGTPSTATPGGVGFRTGAARVVVNITDAPSHTPDSYGEAVVGTHGQQQVLDALRAVNVRLIGIASGDGARAQMERLAIGTGAVSPATNGRCATGIGGAARQATGDRCPLVFDIGADGVGLGNAVVEAIVSFLDGLAFSSVTATTVSDPGAFVQAVHAISATAPEGTALPEARDRLPTGAPDGLDDTFENVLTRTQLTFRIIARNTTVRETEFPQLFFARVQLVGDGVVVGERTVRVIVPEGPKVDGGVDAGGATDATGGDALTRGDVPEAFEAGADAASSL